MFFGASIEDPISGRFLLPKHELLKGNFNYSRFCFNYITRLSQVALSCSDALRKRPLGPSAGRFPTYESRVLIILLLLKGLKRTCTFLPFALILPPSVKKTAHKCCNFQKKCLSLSRQLRKTGDIEESY